MTAALAILLALAAPTHPRLEPEPGSQATIDLRIFEGGLAAGGGPVLVSRTLPDLDTVRFDRDLLALEESKAEGTLLDLPALKEARLLSAPRIVASEGEPARIESGVPPDDPKGVPEVAADVRWSWGDGGVARIALTIAVAGESWTADLRAAPGESVLLARAADGRVRAALLTFRIVEEE